MKKMRKICIVWGVVRTLGLGLETRVPFPTHWVTSGLSDRPTFQDGCEDKMGRGKDLHATLSFVEERWVINVNKKINDSSRCLFYIHRWNL